MIIGMMWYDEDPKKSLETKIAEAAKYYYLKYNEVANVCVVNPLAIPNGKTEIEVNFIRVDTWKGILPQHIWIGKESLATYDFNAAEMGRGQVQGG